MVGEIAFTSEFESYTEELVKLLYKKEYFGFLISSYEYVDKIYEFVIEKIEIFPHKKTPLQLSNLGSNYIHYNPNAKTTWYILFEKKENRFLVMSIFNNYSEESKYFN